MKKKSPSAGLLGLLLLSLAPAGRCSELGWRAPARDPLPFRTPVPAPGGALLLDSPEGLVSMSLDEPARPAAQAAVAWAWPKQFKAAAGRRLLGWFPANAEGARLLYLVKDAAGREERLTEGQLSGRQAGPARRGVTQSLAEIRAVELTALVGGKGAAAGRDVTGADGRPMAELTYADGRKEVVPYDPLVFDLKGTGVKTDGRVTLFDLYGYGRTDRLQWMNDVAAGTGILVFDADGGGRSGGSGSEVFGDRTDLDGNGAPDGFGNGFEALNAFVAKAVKEGVLPVEVVARGLLDAGALAALERAYGLRMKVGGFNAPAVSLAEAGVSAISLSQAATTRAEDFDGRSNDLLVQPGAVFLRADGTTGAYMNVWLRAHSGSAGLARLAAR